MTAVYRRWFERGQDASIEPNVSDSLREVGQEPDRVVQLAGSDQIKAELHAETDIARAAGIFGSPTFAVGDEIFWGDDRLDDAIGWHRRDALKAP